MSLLLRPSDAELEQRFAEIVGASLRVDPSRVTRGTTLDALGAESLDLVEITIDVENAFGILMPEGSILDVGRDVLGDGVLEQGGRLTDLGRRFLALRMPEVGEDALAAVSEVADLRGLFLRVDTWLRVIRFVIDRSPRACAACGGDLVTGSPAKLRCPACGGEVDLPTGDELNREWVRESARALSGATAP